MNRIASPATATTLPSTPLFPSPPPHGHFLHPPIPRLCTKIRGSQGKPLLPYSLHTSHLMSFGGHLPMVIYVALEPATSSETCGMRLLIERWGLNVIEISCHNYLRSDTAISRGSIPRPPRGRVNLWDIFYIICGPPTAKVSTSDPKPISL